VEEVVAVRRGEWMFFAVWSGLAAFCFAVWTVILELGSRCTPPPLARVLDLGAAGALYLLGAASVAGLLGLIGALRRK